jgi:trehalose 6-phosphate phosphatase
MKTLPPPALQHFDAIASRMTGRRPAVFLDYDGTLTPIVDRPEWALLPDDTRQVLARLAALCPVAIVSGRDRDEVERLVGLDSVYYAGSHGFDIAGPGGVRLEHEEGTRHAASLDRAAEALEPPIHRIPGARVERKRFAIAVHYRQVTPSRVREVRRALDDVAARFPDLRATGGKMVFELRPGTPWDKGRAVSWLLDALGLDGPAVLPFYVGDDETDEDAFRAVRDRGVTVLVGESPGETTAEFSVPDAAGTRWLLEAIESLAEGRP